MPRLTPRFGRTAIASPLDGAEGERLADGSCVRLRPERADHVWAYDFVEDRTHDGRKFRMLTIIDEFTRECLAIKVARRLRASDVIEALAELFLTRGVPEHIRSDQGRSS